MWGLPLSDVPLVAWYIGVLVFLEGLLSADNALVLAIMVRHLPKKERRRVLRWGIWGAIGFRFIAVLMSSVLLKFWICKLVGGLYLLYLAISHFVWRGDGDSDRSALEAGPATLNARLVSRSFWKIVASVTLADIAFSIDSILAAVAMGNSFPSRFGPNWQLFIVYVGGVLGIITMRFVVGYFVILLERFPGLAEGAYVLVGWIGIKLIASGIHDALLARGLDEEILRWFHIPEWLFWSVMLLIAVISLLIKPKSAQPQDRDVKASLDYFDPAAANAGSLDDESLTALQVGEPFPSQVTAGKDDAGLDHWHHDGRTLSHGDLAGDPHQKASADKLGDSTR
jgi:YkoY family integral membrane protein